MANKMLIDAAHPEETRVVVIRGSRVEEFDFEAASKKQLRGNIYLAKVTRVEPSLQAAFVDYGGNRHGFLAFSEIHPDYYQIPVSDRQALIDAEAQEEPEEEERRPARRSRRHRRGDRPAAADAHRNHGDSVSEPAGTGEFETGKALADEQDNALAGEQDSWPAHAEAREPTDETVDLAAPAEGYAAAPEATETEVQTEVEVPAATEAEAPADFEEAAPAEPHVAHHHHGGVHYRGDEKLESPAPGEETEEDRADESVEEEEEEEDVSEHVEQLGGDAMEELPVRAHRNRRQYKIQEVIKRRQVLLVQVVKEERGNKGAALTTYLSLAGRYSVLMPNTAKGGGISRKITDAGDRQRLKSIAQDLEVPEGMGVILRTAGASRTKPEVKRDFEYLMRMWETVRETTLGSQAPTLVYEEGSLIKRSIRDLYNKDVEEIIVAGDAGYREAKDFMHLLMPSHARNVHPWHDPQPLFTKAGAEAQLDAMFSSHVTLRSGGYIVINQTEALVAIDVNSGRSTREHNIEDTALRTNLEAADEVARQLRLRDLAGLIVVDFIDMEENRNNRAVEKRIKDALKNDRARIQVGRISHFGLLEMSRQRIRTGVLEGSTVVCAHCAGAGMVRSTSSIALHVLRVLEDALISDASYNVTVRTRAAVALYILNNKRQHLSDLEARFGIAVTFAADESLTGTAYCGVERGEPATGIPQPPRQLPKYEPEPEYEEEDEASEAGEGETAGESEAQGAPSDGAESEGQRRKRRRRRRGRDRESSGITEDAPQPADDALAFVADVEANRIGDEAAQDEDETSGEEAGAPGREPRRGEGGRRRRSRRGGRRTREEIGAEQGEGAPAEAGELGEHGEREIEISVTAVPAHEAPEPVLAAAPAPEPGPVSLEPVPLAPVTPEPKAALPEPVAAAPAEEPAPAPKKPELVSTEPDPAQPKRSGWWQRAKATLGG
jgi:ribonuclease E